MPTIRALKVGVAADTSDLRRGLDQANRRVGRFSRDTETRFQRLARNTTRSFQAMGRATRAFAIAGTAATAATGGLVAVLVRHGRILNNLNRATGASVQFIQAFGQAYSAAGGEVEDVADIFNDITERLSELRAGEDSAIEGFQQLSLTLQDFDGLNTDQIIGLIVQRLSQIPDQADRIRAARFIGNDLARFPVLLSEINERLEENRRLGSDLNLGAVRSTAALATGLLETLTRSRDALLVGLFGSSDVQSIQAGFAQVQQAIIPLIRQAGEIIARQFTDLPTLMNEAKLIALDIQTIFQATVNTVRGLNNLLIGVEQLAITIRDAGPPSNAVFELARTLSRIRQGGTRTALFGVSDEDRRLAELILGFAVGDAAFSFRVEDPNDLLNSLREDISGIGDELGSAIARALPKPTTFDEIFPPELVDAERAFAEQLTNARRELANFAQDLDSEITNFMSDLRVGLEGETQFLRDQIELLEGTDRAATLARIEAHREEEEIRGKLIDLIERRTQLEREGRNLEAGLVNTRITNLANVLAMGDERLKQILEEIRLQMRLRGEIDKLTERQEAVREASQAFATAFSSQIESMILDAKNFGDALRDLSREIQRIVLRALVLRPLEGFITRGLESALGSGGSGLPQGFQRGGVIPGPVGAQRLILAHAGELVLNPTQQRNLAAGFGGGGGVEVNVYNTASDRIAVEASERTGPDGQQAIDFLVRESFQRQIASGEINPSIGAALTRR